MALRYGYELQPPVRKQEALNESFESIAQEAKAKYQAMMFDEIMNAKNKPTKLKVRHYHLVTGSTHPGHPTFAKDCLRG